jgi:hypothetical protein
VGSRSISDEIKNFDAELKDNWWLSINKIVTVYFANTLLILAIIVSIIMAATNYHYAAGFFLGFFLPLYLIFRFLGGYIVRFWRWCSVFPYRVFGVQPPTYVGVGTIALEYLEEEEKKVTKAENVAENAEEEARVAIDSLREMEQKIKSKRKDIEQPESEVLEFKSSVWAQYNNNSGELIDKQKSKSLALEDSIIKTIAAFLNTQGGKLIIGVQDRPKRKVVGIEADFQYSGKSKDIESFQNSLTNAIKTATNDPVIVGTYVEINIEIIDGKSICVIDVKQKAPKSWTYVNMKNWKNKGEKKECFFVRSGPSSNIIESRQSADEWKSARIEIQEYEGN